MAAILDPKTRFFDTYLTKEGRRQLASGELRMRFVSFSDGLTGYDQSDIGVIDTKDGSIFFEAMSRPQDQIITENKSLVNMMGIREQGRQPAFLFEKDEEGNRTGTRIQASLFGDQVIKPPDGRVIDSITTAGIDRIKIDYDLNESMYISGSETQELKYAHSENLLGWWVFEDTMDQIEDAGLQIISSNIEKITTDDAGTTLSQLNSKTAFLSGGSTYAFLKGIPVINGIKNGDPVKYGSFSGNVVSVVVINDSSSKLVRIEIGSKSGDQAVDELIIGTIGSFLNAGNKVSENLKINSSLSTNASYFKIQSTDYTPDSSPTFSDTHIANLSPKVNKSYVGANNKAIRISLQSEFYGVNLRSAADGNTFPLQAGDVSYEDFIQTTAGRTGNQVSAWVYFNGSDDLTKTSNILSIYAHLDSDISKKYLTARVYAIEDDLFLKIHRSNGNSNVTSITLSDVLSSNTWHKISLAWNHKMIALVVDGNMGKSRVIDFSDRENHEGSRMAPTFATSEYAISTEPSDIILGNQLSGFSLANHALDYLDMSFISDTYIRGYIQACEFYKDFEDTDGLLLNEEPEIYSLGNMKVPVFNSDPGFYKYNRFIRDLEIADIEVESIADHFSSGSIIFASPYDENISSGNFIITLTDAVGRVVNFKAIIDGSNARVNDTNYTFRAPSYDDSPEERVRPRNTSFLANMFADTVNIARSNGHLNIEAALVDRSIDGLPSPGRVDLAQKQSGAAGNTTISSTTDSDDSLIITHFSGGIIPKNYVWTVRSTDARVDSGAANKNSLTNPRQEAFEGNVYLDFHNTPIESDHFKKRWVNYYPVASEATLYRGALSVSGSNAYGKEKVIDKDEIFPSLSELADDVSDIISGSLESFKDLFLLGHLDLEKSDENQGFVVERFKQELSQNQTSVIRGEKYSQHEDRVFKTRLENFPFLEHVYGQQNDYLSGEIKLLQNLEGPSSGLVFQKESTLLNIEEILDNELDNDEETTSSTRLPNFFFLPPLADERFVFDDQDYDYNVEVSERSQPKPPFRQALNHLLSQGLTGENADFNLSNYRTLFCGSQFKGILPESVITNLGNSLTSRDNDSNKALIAYLARNANTTEENSITTSLLEFNEEIDFVQTSFNQNTFIQMFELSENDGKPSLSKLAIKDMGVFFRQHPSGNLDIEDIEFRGSPMGNLDSRPIGEVTVFMPPRTGGQLVHVFTFGKVITHREPNHPGLGIYYLPIFYLECILGE